MHASPDTHAVVPRALVYKRLELRLSLPVTLAMCRACSTTMLNVGMRITSPMSRPISRACLPSQRIKPPAPSSIACAACVSAAVSHKSRLPACKCKQTQSQTPSGAHAWPWGISCWAVMKSLTLQQVLPAIITHAKMRHSNAHAGLGAKGLSPGCAAGPASAHLPPAHSSRHVREARLKPGMLHSCCRRPRSRMGTPCAAGRARWPARRGQLRC